MNVPMAKLLRSLAVSSTLVLAASPALSQSVPFDMPANANIYGAGHAVPPAPGGSGAGVLPTLVDLPPGLGRTITFTGVTGSIDFGDCCAPNGADGVASAGNAPSNDWDGLAGMTISRGRFVAAVFLDDTEPFDPPPAKLSIPSIAFTTLAPGLRQTYFVGDGLTGTGSGSAQVFTIPDSATRLFLGVHDAGPPNNTVPGWYGDNTGMVSGVANVQHPASPGAGRVWQLLLSVPSPSDLQLDWQPSCSADDNDYAVFSGDLGLFSSHSREVCSTGGLTTATIPMPADDRYYLVVPVDGADEGSYGKDSDGVERPVGVVSCGTQDISSTCP